MVAVHHDTTTGVPARINAKIDTPRWIASERTLAARGLRLVGTEVATDERGVLDRFTCSWGFVELATAELLRAGGIHGVLLIGVGEPLLAEPIPLVSVAGMVLTVAGLALVVRPATRNDPGTIWNA